MAAEMRITVVIDDDNTSLYGADPEHIEGVDQVASLSRLVELTRDAVEKAYPEAELRVLADSQSEVTVTQQDDEGYTIEDEGMAETVNSIAHEVWESWEWVILLEPVGQDLNQ
jgi:hypothetical protein